MRKTLIKSLVGSGLVLGAMTLGAQQYNPQQYPPQGDYQRYDRGDFNRGEYRNTLINRVKSDLNWAQSRAYGDDRWRISLAINMLNDFQSRMNSGNVDRRELDMTIDHVQRVLDNNQLPFRVQQNLSSDVNRLRDLSYRLSS